MYTFHFYAASHGQSYRNELKSALDRGLPIFILKEAGQWVRDKIRNR